ncbi:MAG: tRNA (adenosine(37)-N6)-threonylcarbamoyltransferase complex ATPase subunit type 1 TsaE [Clostridiales bacterium]|nr:tRNA (adenosine(37)-N6)-threonylcarbamoyltransferase complex ATPase subunit type 1 TsaE [Candidatus Apopatousia equi]
MKYITRNEEETFSLASEFEKTLKGGEVVVLNGELGAGKTTFTKGLCKALNITENITSPTFTLMNVYKSGRLPLYHFDMYRIEDESEANELGLQEFFNSNAVCMIEWAENIKNMLPKKVITINITKLGDNEREFEII